MYSILGCDFLKILISNSSIDPIYKQISDQIKKLILNETLSQGEPLPSIRTLARDLKVSVITTKRVYEELERSQLIETIKGKGSFVAPQKKDDLHNIKLEIVEKHLLNAIKESKALNLSINDIKNLLDNLYSKS